MDESSVEVRASLLPPICPAPLAVSEDSHEQQFQEEQGQNLPGTDMLAFSWCLYTAGVCAELLGKLKCHMSQSH